MADNTTTTIKIPQFDGTNFSNWKYRVGILLDEKGLRVFIQEDLVNILGSTEAGQREAVKLQEKKCISILVQTIHDGQLEYIKEKTTAKEMFDTLCSVFERKSISSQLYLRKQLLMMKYRESDDIIAHFLKFDTKIRELKSTGAKMEDLDIVVHLLLTLPETYDNLVTALETMDQDKLNLEFVKTRLMDEHNKRTGRESSSKSNEPGAMHVKGKKKKRVTCYSCGKPGHKAPECRSTKKKGKDSENANEAQATSKESTMCAIVNEHVQTCTDEFDARSVCKAQQHSYAAQAYEHDSNNGRLTVHAAHRASKCADTQQIKFVLDSGATQHMVNNKRYFEQLKQIDEVEISVAKKNACISAKQQGEISVKTFHNGDNSTKTMKDVLLVKDLKCNLMSIRSLTKQGYRVVFENDYAYASIDGKTKFVAHTSGKLYEVVLHVDRNVFAGISSGNNLEKFSQSLWHCRMGHLNVFDMKKMISNQMIKGLEQVNVDTDSMFCESCVFSKQKRASFPKNKNARSSRILELIHSDVCGPMPTTAYDGSKYFVTFTDDFSRASMVYFIKRKCEVLDKFKEYSAMVEAMHNMKIAKLRVDNGGEYTSNEFKQFCQTKGIQMSFTVAYTPEMNSISERLNQTLQGKARSMLLASGLDHKFWNEAILTANYLKNRSSTNAVGKQFVKMTPAEIWFGCKPDLSHLRIFGSECFNHIPSNNRSKLEARSTKCLMLGYAASMGSYRLWDIEKNKLIIGRHVTFNEASVLKRMKLVEISVSEAELNQSDGDKGMVDEDDDMMTEDESFQECEESDDDKVHDANEDGAGNNSASVHGTKLDRAGNHNLKSHGTNQDCTGDNGSDINSANEECTGNHDRTIPRIGERIRRKPDRYGEWTTIAEANNFALCAERFVEDDPETVKEAKSRNDWPQWKSAIQFEYESLVKNKTWTVCDLPKERRAITNKWVFKLKRKADGQIDKYKARLVARGFTQRLGFDYSETYAPVAKLVTLKILLAVANQKDMHIHQMDVKSAFLNGELKEEIYMELPEGFKQGNKVCKLNKALYGLKQASRAWNEKFNDFMMRIKFEKCVSDQCLYVKKQNDKLIYVLLYVDDILIFCEDIGIINTVKKLFSKEFEMVDMDKASSFLGMHIDQNIEKGTITLSQSKYLEKVLERFNMLECKPKSTPMEKGLHLEYGDKNKCSDHPYRELIGCLIYATVTTRPDLCAATGYFSRFQGCFDERHFTHAKHILRYIRGTTDLKLVYTKQTSAPTLVGFSDSDWGGDKNDGRSTSGYVFKLFGNTVSWASRKQSTVSLSSTEAEYVALTEAICECKWIRKLLAELNIDCVGPVVIFEDNQSCIRVADDQKTSKRMKHLDIKYHFICEAVANGEVELEYKPTNEQLADIMTKGLGRSLFVEHRANLNLI